MYTQLDYNPPAHIELDILYKDDQLIILNKPSGLLSVPGRGIDKSDCMLSRLQIEYPAAKVVHRLDMQTSGIIMYALTIESQRALSMLFEKKTISKQYIAKVFGKLKQPEGVINQPLIVDWPNRPLQKIDFQDGKPSITRYVLISTDGNANSLVQLYPITGRTHQLRVHMRYIGNPILGDDLYGTPESRSFSPRLLLHAEQLTFSHPMTGKKIQITCPSEFI